MMRRIPILVFFFMAALPVGAQTIWTSIVSPDDGDLVFGEVDIVVDVVSTEMISEVEFQLAHLRDARHPGVGTVGLGLDLNARNEKEPSRGRESSSVQN